KLTSEVQTSVSVVVYDVDRVHEYYQSINKIYENDLLTLRGNSRFYPATVNHCDCKLIPEYALPSMKDGVDVFYRPARFGRAKTKKNHSGWECWRKIK
ncbi:MAG: hypothetical protein OQJ81_03530, partial [Melioribacteraceae bacterium]|nr:hypothetical protein [Melioribacteraceae bacterium]